MAVIDFGPNNFTITVSGTAVANHAPVELQIAGHTIGTVSPQEWVSKLTEGVIGVLSESNEQVSKLTAGVIGPLSEGNEQVTKLTLGVLVDITMLTMRRTGMLIA